MTEDAQPMTIRLPRPLHGQLRRLAFETRESMNDIALAGIAAEIARRQPASTEIPLRRRPPAETRALLLASGLPVYFADEMIREEEP